MSIENNKLMNLADGKVLYDDVRGRAEDIKAGIAQDYSELTFPVSAGKRCWHDGGLYTAAQDIAQSEAWTAAHWTATTIDNELLIASTDSVVPVFSYGMSGLECDMTFAEVFAAIRANKCTACLVNAVEVLLSLSLYQAGFSKIVFNSTVGGTIEGSDADGAEQSFTVEYNSDGTVALKAGGIYLPSVLAKAYDQLTFPVAAGTLCYHESNLLKANQTIAATENFTPAHWDATTVENELNSIKNNMSIVPVFSYDSTSGDYVCDKSFAEVYAAFQAGRCTSCIYMSQSYPLLTAGQYGVVFSGVTLASRLPVAMNTLVTLGNDESVQVTFNEFNLSNYVAPQYSNSIFPVSAGDLCITNNHLYKAKVDISSYESFNSSKWDEVILANELSDKTDKVSGATSGNFAGLDANGNLTDSGHKHSDYLTSHQDISGKADKADTVLDTTLSMGRKANTTVGTNSTALGYDVEASGNKSHAEGSETSATASSSHSEGYKSTASGQASHAEGGNTTSSGNMSHAEGAHSTSSGYGSHAEGSYTEASNQYAHAEGLNSTASGYVAHAEGSETTASGAYSHAEGNSTTASGMDSHASGDHTTAYGRAETVVGSYNATETVTFSQWVSGASYAVGDKVQNNSEYFICKTANSDTVFNHNNWDNVPYNTDKKGLFVVGNGYKPYTGSTVYSNAMFVDWDGNTEISGDLTVLKGSQNETSVSGLKSAFNELPKVVDAEETDADLYVTDNQGNVIVELADGHIKTKNFNSKEIETDMIMDSDAESDVDITDKFGNVIVRFEDGHIKTKNFDSSSVSDMAETLNEAVGNIDDLRKDVTVLESDTSGILYRNKDMIDGIYAACRWHQPHATDKQFCILLSGDIHGDGTRMASIIEFLNKIDAFDAGIMLGDISAWNLDTTWYTNAISKAEKPFLTVVGNHDSAGSSSAYSGYENIHDFYEKFIEPNLPYAGLANGEHESDNVYYYKDFHSQKIRIIVLNQYDYPSDKNGDSYVYTRGNICYSQEQINWLVNTLNSTPSDYGVIIAMHVHPGWMDKQYDNILTASTAGNAGAPTSLISATNGYIIEEIVNAWVNGTALTQTFDYTVVGTYGTSVTVNADFTARGQGEFITYISGHWHMSVVSKSHNRGQASYTVAASGLNAETQSDQPRRAGTRSEDHFAALAVDRDTKTVKVIQVGAHFSKDGYDRLYGAFSYNIEGGN